MATPKSEAPTPEKVSVKAPSKRGEAGKRNVSGVWMVYREPDGRTVVIAPHADELEARRALDDELPETKVVFVRWGQTVVEALAK